MKRKRSNFKEKKERKMKWRKRGGKRKEEEVEEVRGFRSLNH
jgi:hypothetical protein